MGARRNIAAFLAVAVATSTRQGCAEARQRMGRYRKLLWVLAIVAWAALILGGISPLAPRGPAPFFRQ